MKEFQMTVTYTVVARDYDEAVEAAKSVIEYVKNMPEGWTLRDLETSRIQEA